MNSEKGKEDLSFERRWTSYLKYATLDVKTWTVIIYDFRWYYVFTYRFPSSLERIFELRSLCGFQDRNENILRQIIRLAF